MQKLVISMNSLKIYPLRRALKQVMNLNGHLSVEFLHRIKTKKNRDFLKKRKTSKRYFSVSFHKFTFSDWQPIQVITGPRNHSNYAIFANRLLSQIW